MAYPNSPGGIAPDLPRIQSQLIALDETFNQLADSVSRLRAAHCRLMNPKPAEVGNGASATAAPQTVEGRLQYANDRAQQLSIAIAELAGDFDRAI